MRSFFESPSLWAVLAAVGIASALLYGLLSRDQPLESAWSLALPVGLTAGGLMLLVQWALSRGALVAVEQDLLLQALDAASVGHALTDPGETVIYANNAFISLCAGEARIGSQKIQQMISPGDETELAALENLLRTARSGGSGQAVLPFETVGEATIWRRFSVAPVEARPGHLLWSVTDVSTEQRRLEALRGELAVLGDLLENLPVGVYSIDEAGTFQYANAVFAEWLGHSAGDLVGNGRRLGDFLVEDAGSSGLGAPSKKATSSNLIPLDNSDANPGNRDAADPPPVRLRGRHGEVVQVRIAQTVGHGARDGRAWTRSVVRPLSVRDDWEDLLRRSEKRFHRIFEEAPVGIVEADSRGHIVAYNRAFGAMVGPQRERLHGRPVAKLLRPDEAPRVEAALTHVARGGGGSGGQALEVRLSGTVETVADLYVARNDDGRGQPTGFILHFIDATDQKRLEAQFAQSQKMQAVGQLAGGVAHDFNNLLTAMIGFCDLLLIRHRPGEQSFADVMQIKQTANRAAALVRQLLAFSRQQPLQSRVLDVNNALAELAHMIRRLIGENIELSLVHGRDLPLVKVDPGQLDQVIINLAVNARDAMLGVGASGGTLSVHTGVETITTPKRREGDEVPEGDYVTLTVEDTGPGIPPDVQQRIFDPFFSTKEVGSGTGLGLSTVYGIVKQTGGFVFVDGRPGTGARFEILLPAHAADLEAAADNPAANDGTPEPAPEPLLDQKPVGDLTGTATVLLVEDEDAVRRFTARALRNKGYDLLEASSGDVALEMLTSGEHRVDLMISDVVMPRMDGPELIAKAREHFPDMKVVFISGYAEDTFRERLNDDVGIHFLAKPFSLKQLAKKVKELLDEE